MSGRKWDKLMVAIPEISMEELIERYGVLLFDAFGVLINSSGPLAGASELIADLNRIKKPYYILTNDASRLPQTAAKKYQGRRSLAGPDMKKEEKNAPASHEAGTGEKGAIPRSL